MAIGGSIDGERCSPAASSGTGFRGVLLAALRTRYYGTLMRASGLGTPKAVAGLGSLDQALARLPRVEPGLVPLHSPTLVNAKALPGEPGGLFWPLPRPGRIALFSDFFAEDGAVRRFTEHEYAQLLSWSPESLAAPSAILEHLARLTLRNDEGARLRLSHSVLAFFSLRRAFLDDSLRDLLWRAWQVPVFGQFLGPSAELLAWECEAHQGYHFDPARVVFEVDGGSGGGPELLVTSLVSFRRPLVRMATRLTGRIDTGVCPCASALPRLARVAPLGCGRQTAPLARAACAAD